MKWVNFGGGHHITRKDYDVERLLRIVRHFHETYGVTVYLEPGEAVVLNAGYLVTSCSGNRFIMEWILQFWIPPQPATCRMFWKCPIVRLLQNSGEPGEKSYTYRLGGPTCLAGDVIGDYSFDMPLKEGDRLVFEDMALYTMVKTNTFNGTPLPSIALRHVDGSKEVIRSFGYEDFKKRLS